MPILEDLLQEGRTYRESNEVMMEIDSLNIESSLEGFSDTIKNLLKQIKEAFKRFIHFIKEMFNTYVKKFKTRSTVERLNKSLDRNYISDKELNEIIQKFIKKENVTIPNLLASNISISRESVTNGDLNELIGIYFRNLPIKRPMKDILHIFDADGKLTNVNSVIENVTILIDRLDKMIDNITDGELPISDDPEENAVFSKRYYNYSSADNLILPVVFQYKTKGQDTKPIWDVVEETGFNTNINVKDIKEFIRNIPNYLKSSERFYDSYIPKFKRRLLEVEKIEDKTDAIKQEIYILKNILKIAAFPQACVLQMIRFVEFVTKEVNSFEYITTDIPPAKPIYHLSENKNLKLLTPRSGGAYGNEFLPPRVSFSDKPEHCLTGIDHHFEEQHNPFTNDSEIAVREFYVYEGIQVKGKTRYLKPALVESAMHGVKQYRTPEICVATEIKVKRIGIIEIKFRTKYKPSDRNFLVDFNITKNKK